MKCPINQGTYCWACDDVQYRECMTLRKSMSKVDKKMYQDQHGPICSFHPDAVTRNWDWIFHPSHYVEANKKFFKKNGLDENGEKISVPRLRQIQTLE